MRFTGSDAGFEPDGEGGRYLVGTFELEVIEGTGIYRSVVGGQPHGRQTALSRSWRRFRRRRRILRLLHQRPITPVETRSPARRPDRPPLTSDDYVA
jgi:hypothetical protein